jgi:FkbM family methyltransferase
MKVTKFILENSLGGFDKFSIVDIGARGHNLDGLQALENRLKYFGFEADQKECVELNKKANNYKGDFRYFPIALSGNEGRRKFYITNDEACSSLITPSTKVTQYLNLNDKLRIEKEIELETTTLDLWQQKEVIPRVDYIKIDVQGAELEILNAGKGLLANCLAVYTEVEFVEVYSDQSLFNDLDRFMTENDFFLYDILKIKSKRKSVSAFFKSRGQLVWGDAIYFKKIELLIVDDEKKNYEILIKQIILTEYFHVIDYGVFLIDKFIDDGTIGDVKLINQLKKIRDRIISTYGNKMNLTKFDVLIKTFYNINLFARILNRIILAVKKIEFDRNSVHSKYFWRE